MFDDVVCGGVDLCGCDLFVLRGWVVFGCCGVVYFEVFGYVVYFGGM